MSYSTSSVSGILSDNASSKWPGEKKRKQRRKEGEKHKARLPWNNAGSINEELGRIAYAYVRSPETERKAQRSS